ncbi:eEF1A lysine and N-terminal methyltransferase isoform X2 [Medicago truncatula]|uniref:S-adenosylmethionine-dependent methyltransferase, putative n=1 Tax=Medicago truncatula TaxID=3880 RepID=A0A072TTY2_MEDTR|nr:eEF1A lysine and N-terminal methyltransferase isoform X2 [Medicago truncatula]KEH20656.1 S-adenosylmethionine-dependent methyltransferase, putative [Medicago truncatula]
MASKSKTEKKDLLDTLGDFTSKENWDNFFTIRPDSFEWYAEWPHLRDPLISLLQTLTPPPPASLPVLVPGCGNSRLSEHLYDAGFTSITNIDFSKVVIGDMLRRNIRSRPLMRWRVMDMTAMQFEDEFFGAVVDKGGLDALMEPELGPTLGNQYLSEVKRVLKPGGKFVCLTLAESHVLDILFSKFRLGWKMSVDAIPMKSSGKPNLQTFMVVVEKELSTAVHQITSLLQNASLHCNSEQASGLREALQNENQVREKLSSSSDKLYSMENLQVELIKISQGRRVQLTLGGQGCSVFSYRAAVFDAEEQSDPFTYHCGVFIVPKIRAREWLFFSEEGQWMVVRSSKAARLIMVFLDTSHTNASMDEIQKDLSPLVKQLEPKENENGAQIPFLMASDGIKKRNIVDQITSSLTGSIIVEDVVYENVDSEVGCIFPSRELIFRRLVFERAANLVQSEALLTVEHLPTKLVGETERKKTNSSSKSKKRAYNQLTVYHGYVASSYHTGIISGFTLISSYMENVASSGKMVKAVVIGLGAGLLPMFLHRCIPVLEIEAVELDPVIVDIARKHFRFVEDKRLKVHIADGIQFVRESASFGAAQSHSKSNNSSYTESPSNGSSTSSHAEDVEATKVDIIIIDVDSSDSSSGLACPAPDFLEESFLESVKDKLSEQGLFVVNLVSRSQAIKDMVLLRMKKVFSHIFCLQFDEDVNEIHFALKSASPIKDHCFSEASLKLNKLLKFNHPEIGQKIINATKQIRRLN